MADLSNGYTKVANEIQQLKPRLRMSGREWQCFEAVIWLTYGWNKKQDRVTNTVIAELTGLSDSHVSDALKSLAERKIIFSQKQGVMKTVGINTDLSAWILDKPKTGKVFPKSWGSADDLKAARWIYDRLLTVNASLSEPNWAEWANTIRLMRVQDKRTHYEICDLFQWANRDEFWKDNILSPSSLRKQWDQLTTKRLRATGTVKPTRGGIDLHNTDWIDGVLE